MDSKHIKSITIVVTDKINDNKHEASYTEFDFNGNEVLSIDRDIDGSINAKNVSVYDVNNNRVEMMIYSFDESVPDEKHIFYRNDNHIIEKTVIEYLDGSKSVKTYKRENLKLTIETVDEEGQIEEKEIDILDDADNIIEKKVWDYEGTLTLFTTQQFDDKNQMVKQYFFDAKGEETNHRAYSYNSDGNLLKMLVLNPQGELIDSRVYNYDEKGRILSSQTGTRSITNYEYDDENNIEIQTVIGANGVEVSRTQIFKNSEGKTVKEDNFAVLRESEYEYY